MLVAVVMVMGVRTGLRTTFSTARLAGVAAAGLGVAQLDPAVAENKVSLAGQGHRLSEVGQEGGAWRVIHTVQLSATRLDRNVVGQVALDRDALCYVT